MFSITVPLLSITDIMNSKIYVRKLLARIKLTCLVLLVQNKLGKTEFYLLQFCSDMITQTWRESMAAISEKRSF